MVDILQTKTDPRRAYNVVTRRFRGKGRGTFYTIIHNTIHLGSSVGTSAFGQHHNCTIRYQAGPHASFGALSFLYPALIWYLAAHLWPSYCAPFAHSVRHQPWLGALSKAWHARDRDIHQSKPLDDRGLLGENSPSVLIGLNLELPHLYGFTQ